MQYRNAQGGFTLTELLVSTAIFAILMTSIGAMFVASLHAVRAGYQSHEAYEKSRGTFNVVERDLATVFTSRDFGQYYQFYGNEYGMTMVGLLKLRDASGREYTRIGRVTYVIYPVVLRAANEAFYVTEPFALDYDKKIGTIDDGFAPGFRQTRGVRYAGNDPNSDAGSLEIGVAALIRYVEPGVSDLDSFPFDWNTFVDYYDGNPEFPSNNVSEYIREQLDDSLVGSAPSASPSSDIRVLARLTNERDQMFAAKKRDLWLRMLSCQEYWIPQLSTGPAILPNIWKDGWLNGTPGGAGVNPRDYVVVENLGVATLASGAARFPLRAYRWFNSDPKPYQPFFEFGKVGGDGTAELMPYWNANNLAYIALPREADGVDNDRNAQLFVTDGIDNNGDGVVDDAGEATFGIDDPGERVVFPRFDSDLDGQLDGLDPTDFAFGAVIDTADAFGSPLHPRLPEAVMVRLPMVYSAAYVGAPNFERSMEQLVDVPTAYTRSRLASEGP